MGRPREIGVERYPGGKKKPASATAPTEVGLRTPISGALWQRMQADAEKVFGDPRFGTELGRLGATGQITPGEVATGFRIAGIYGRFEFYKGLRRSAASPHYIREFVAESAGAESDPLAAPAQVSDRDLARAMLDNRDDREREASEAFKDLQRVLPHEFRSHVERLCVENEHVGYQGLVRARIGIAIAREHFQDKEKRNSSKPRKKARVPARAVPPPKPSSPGINAFKEAFFELHQKGDPALIELAWGKLCALKARQDFRRAKSEGGST